MTVVKAFDGDDESLRCKKNDDDDDENNEDDRPTIRLDISINPSEDRADSSSSSSSVASSSSGSVTRKRQTARKSTSQLNNSTKRPMKSLENDDDNSTDSNQSPKMRRNFATKSTSGSNIADPIVLDEDENSVPGERVRARQTARKSTSKNNSPTKGGHPLRPLHTAGRFFPSRFNPTRRKPQREETTSSSEGEGEEEGETRCEERPTVVVERLCEDEVKEENEEELVAKEEVTKSSNVAKKSTCRF